MRFAISADSTGRPSWWLYDANNKLMAWAGTSFVSSADAARAADQFTSEAASAEFDVVVTSSNIWLWRARLAGDLVVASTRGCTTKQNACRAAHNVRDHVGCAIGPSAHQRTRMSTRSRPQHGRGA